MYVSQTSCTVGPSLSSSCSVNSYRWTHAVTNGHRRHKPRTCVGGFGHSTSFKSMHLAMEVKRKKLQCPWQAPLCTEQEQDEDADVLEHDALHYIPIDLCSTRGTEYRRQSVRDDGVHWWQRSHAPEWSFSGSRLGCLDIDIIDK